MALTKERLVAALKVAKTAKDEADAAKAGEAAAKAELETVKVERDQFKADHEIVADPEVNALVDELAPEAPAPVEVPEA